MEYFSFKKIEVAVFEERGLDCWSEHSTQQWLSVWGLGISEEVTANLGKWRRVVDAATGTVGHVMREMAETSYSFCNSYPNNIIYIYYSSTPIDYVPLL